MLPQSSFLFLMAPPEWSDAAYRSQERESAGSSGSGPDSAPGDCTVMIEQLMFIEPC
jgi:hypothetical protein